MGLPFWAGVLGAVVALVFLVRAFIQLKKDTPGHAHNAAMIHVPMGGMLLIGSAIIMIAYAP
ncbi:hypothetical protein [Porphyrobacter sp. AAP60]|uniref:hypothetical protein n=1 Tax=Porphyrobacter sp. AAP60 TaxID=1523423 RepID=UPI0006B973B0|nr:hypothetical protein [Porphyrobacter sp. AAP60]